jgi:hypothetical protein
MLEQKLSLNTVRGREHVDELVSRILQARRQPCVELHAVTGLEHGVLEHGRTTVCPEHERANALTELDRSRPMAETQADKPIHPPTFLPQFIRSSPLTAL